MDKPEVPYFHLTMELDDLSHAPKRQIPAGYGVSLFRPGSEADWARVECQAGEFPAEDQALAHFGREFAPHTGEMKERCLFLHGPDGRAIATATAWYGEVAGQRIGRLHWVAIVPAFQGRGLAKPLVSNALALMAKWHERAYLTTQTTSWIAVKVYRDLGFRPVADRPDSGEAWALMARVLGDPALSGGA